MTAAIDQIKQQGNELFDKRGSLMTLWQEEAEQFYCERADFTATRSLGRDFAANLMTSYPLMMRRDLGNIVGAMLRPSGKDWVAIRTNRPDREDTGARQYLEWATKFLRNAIYDKQAQFVRATKEADHDFVTFGQAVIQSNLFRPLDGSTPHLIHRCWHLRDCAWLEGRTGAIDTVFRKWEPYVVDLCAQFPETVNAELRAKALKTPYEKIKCWHVLMPSDRYNGMDGSKKINERLHKFVSLFIAIDQNLELECLGQRIFTYTIPRWQTVSGSQYAHSPCTVAALPEARLHQAIARVLLEAGEKAIDPPMVGVRDVVVGNGLNLFAGGFTAIDGDYEGKLSEALAPITLDTKNLSFGEGMLKDGREQLTALWMLNKLNLPPNTGKVMTAFETGQRIQEYIRNALPLFEPMETEYNGQLCEVDFELLMEASAELRNNVPQSIRGAEWKFVFESPLKEATERVKIGQFTEAAQILTQAIPLDPTAAFILNGKTTIRDVMSAAVPASWMNTEDAVDKMTAAKQAEDQRQALLQKLGLAAKVAKDAGGGLNQAAQGVTAGGLAG